MTRMLPGRTDNGIKNRFHHLRRRLDKCFAKNSKHQVDMKELSRYIRTDKMEKYNSDEPCEITRKTREVLAFLAAESVQSKGSGGRMYTFGPFREALPSSRETCNRCHLFIPSAQTGRAVCKRTGWCEACTEIPTFVNGNLLRECLNLRRPGGESLEALFEMKEVKEDSMIVAV
mmetsp:Transcript_7373/g.9777  ORF Transcript_7373/g.9777 Transcript_7373/m.9777 type:complete len:174 (-) Transcript_7373:106-627(-)